MADIVGVVDIRGSGENILVRNDYCIFFFVLVIILLSELNFILLQMETKLFNYEVKIQEFKKA